MTVRDIKPGDEISADWWPPAVTVTEGTDQLNITSTAYTEGTPEAGVLFTAPLTGRVAVCIQASLDQESAGNRVYVSFQIFEGTSSAGTLVQAAVDAYGVCSPGNAASEEECRGNMTVVQNLTAGAVHYARVMHRTEAGNTNDVRFRGLIVFPLA